MGLTVDSLGPGLGVNVDMSLSNGAITSILVELYPEKKDKGEYTYTLPYTENFRFYHTITQEENQFHVPFPETSSCPEL